MSTPLAQNLIHARTHYKAPDGRCGLTQIELAQRAGMQPNAVSAIETGVIEHPQHLTLARLAVALDTTVEVLLGEDGTPPTEPQSDSHPSEARRQAG